jgi:LysM repeat protein
VTDISLAAASKRRPPLIEKIIVMFKVVEPRSLGRPPLTRRPARSLLFLVALAAAFLLMGRPAPVAAQGQTKLVLAFYYAWYGPDSFGPGKTPFQPPQPYASSNSSVIQQHVGQAKSAGIDAFVQSWYGPAPNQTESNFQALLNVASANGFRAAVDFETGSPFFTDNGDRAAALSTLLATHANHPAYLRVDGKPVVFFWANWVLSVGEWAQIREQADPGRNSIWIAEGSNLDYLSVFDGLHLYNTAWSANPAGTAITWADRTRNAAQTYGGFRYWVATAMPGFNDSLLGRGEATVVRNRAAGAYYQSSFAGAAASAPDMLIITSFNEWAEGSNIEPSVEFGNLYLDLTRQLSAAFKSGAVPAAPPPAPATVGPTLTPSPSPTFGPSPTPTNTATPTETPTPTDTPTPVASPTAQADGLIVYIAQPGDSYIYISELFDVPLAELYDLNGLDEGSILTVGQRLILGQAGQSGGRRAGDDYPGAIILPGGDIVYQLREGDSLYSVAQRYNLTIEELMAFNEDLEETSILQVGQQIVVGFQPLPAEVGGSTDQPQPTATSSQTPLATATSTETPIPTATGTAAPTSLPTVQMATAQPESTSAGDGIDGILLILIGVVAFLAILGGVFLYLGRPR